MKRIAASPLQPRRWTPHPDPGLPPDRVERLGRDPARRLPLTPDDHERGRRLALTLRAARGPRTMASVAGAVGMSVETLRKIESGRVPTPAFFTVTALAAELGLPLDALAEACALPDDGTSARTA